MFFATWISFNENQRRKQNTYTPWNWQFAHENRPKRPKRKFIFQPSIFKGELLVPRRFQGYKCLKPPNCLFLCFTSHIKTPLLKGHSEEAGRTRVDPVPGDSIRDLEISLIVGSGHRIFQPLRKRSLNHPKSRSPARRIARWYLKLTFFDGWIFCSLLLMAEILHQFIDSLSHYL